MLEMLYVTTSTSSRNKNTHESCAAKDIKQESPPSLQLISVHSPENSVVSGEFAVGIETCTACQNILSERMVIFVEGKPYHPSCFRCAVCEMNLEFESSCYVRDGVVLCRTDYAASFRKHRSCAKCHVLLQRDDVVNRARDAYFHLNCFNCYVCGAALRAGDLFSMSSQMQLFCQEHIEARTLAPHCEGQHLDLERVREENSEEPEEYAADEQPVHNRSKRMRTSFKHHQLRTMKQYFNLNHNPDAKDLKQLAQKTGLNKRVLQVWFQNARAKYRRSMQQREGSNISPSMHPSLSIDSHFQTHASSSSNQSSDYNISTSPDRVREFYEPQSITPLLAL